MALTLGNHFVQVLDGSVDLLRDIVEGENKGHRSQGRQQGVAPKEDPVSILHDRLLSVANNLEADTKETEKKKVDRDKESWTHKLERIWALGPHRVGPNLLLTPDSKVGSISKPAVNGVTGVLIRGTPHFSQKLGLTDSTLGPSSNPDNGSDISLDFITEVQNLESSVVSGFQLATASGPLCEEPMWGLAFSVEASVSQVCENQDGSGAELYGPFSSQVHVLHILKCSFYKSYPSTQWDVLSRVGPLWNFCWNKSILSFKKDCMLVGSV